MTDGECVDLLRDFLPQFGLAWRGFRRFRRQVCKRLARRMRAMGVPDVQAYRARLAADPDERSHFDGLCRITLSRFYRDRAVFDRLRAEELPRLAGRAAQEGRPLRCWSAGCASGEEPYTLALVLRLGLSSPPPFTLLATDADAALLERARVARYARATLRELPPSWVERAFAGDCEGFLQLRPEYRAGVRWVPMDLRRDLPDGPFDLVLCRNLAFTYFAPALQSATLERLAQRLAPDGVLVIGAHEQLPHGEGWSRVATLPIYQRRSPRT